MAPFLQMEEGVLREEAQEKEVAEASTSCLRSLMGFFRKPSWTLAMMAAQLLSLTSPLPKLIRDGFLSLEFDSFV